MKIIVPVPLKTKTAQTATASAEMKMPAKAPSRKLVSVSGMFPWALEMFKVAKKLAPKLSSDLMSMEDGDDSLDTIGAQKLAAGFKSAGYKVVRSKNVDGFPHFDVQSKDKEGRGIYIDFRDYEGEDDGSSQPTVHFYNEDMQSDMDEGDEDDGEEDIKVPTPAEIKKMAPAKLATLLDDLADLGEEALAAGCKSVVQTLSVDQLAKLMSGKSYPTVLFPSQWPSNYAGGYPEKLAKALVSLPKSKETVTDLLNVYYNSRDLTPEAKAVFIKDLTGKNTGYIEFFRVFFNLYGVTSVTPASLKKAYNGHFEIFLPNGFKHLLKEERATFKKMLLTIPKPMLKVMTDNAWKMVEPRNYLNGETARNQFLDFWKKEMGIDFRALASAEEAKAEGGKGKAKAKK